VTGIYDRNEYLVEKRRALDAWAALLSIGPRRLRLEMPMPAGTRLFLKIEACA